MHRWRWLGWVCVSTLIVLGLGSIHPRGLAQTEPVPPPLVVYQPVQRLEWEGLQRTPQGLEYFALTPLHENFFIPSEGDLYQAQQMGNREAEAEALLKLGLADHLGGNFYTQAEAYYKQGLEVAQDLRDRTLEILLLGNLSLLYLQHSFFYRDAVDYLEQLYAYTWHGAYYYEGSDPRWAEMVLGNLGNLFLGADYYSRALELHQQRLTLAQELRDTAGEGKALGDLGTVYQGLGDYTKAIDYHQQRLTLARRHQDGGGLGQALSSLGIAYHSLGDYAQARDYQEQFLQVARDRNQLRWQEQALANLAGAYFFLGDTDRAIALYEEAIAIAQQINETQMLATIRNNLGLVYQQQGNLEASQYLYERALRSATYRDNLQGEAIAWNNLGAGHLKAGNIEAAIAAYYQSLTRLESARGRLGGNDAHKISLFETQRFPYENLQTLLLAQGQSETALAVAERGRARAFVDLLSRRLGSSDVAAMQIPTVEQLKTLARDRQATLVEYSLLSAPAAQGSQPNRLAIWVISPEGSITARQVPFAETLPTGSGSLQELVWISRLAIGARGLGIAATPVASASIRDASSGDPALSTSRLARLSTVLIDPIADLLPSDPEQPVIIVPQAELFLVPFAALPTADGHTLIDQHTLIVVPSLQALDLSTRLDSGSQNVVRSENTLIVGNPQMPSVAPSFGAAPQSLPPLPGTETEAIAIGQLLGVSPLLGAQATETAVKAQLRSARLIHLATHGLLDETQGLSSAIALTPSAQDDGLLTAAELLSLSLRADLVVLSACDTGRGRITGDGVIGLSRSLLAAGVPRLVVSLWQVPDQPTADLMTAFYTALQSGADTAHALRTAMIQIRDRYPTPSAWAGFIVVGDGVRRSPAQ